MTARKDPDIERQVDVFNWQVWRRDNVRRVCRKPTTCQQWGEGGYHAAWTDVLDVISEALDRHDCPGPVLEDLLVVARSVLETTWTEVVAERWASAVGPASE